MGLVDPRVGLSGCRLLLVRLVGSRPVRCGGSRQWVCDSCRCTADVVRATAWQEASAAPSWRSSIAEPSDEPIRWRSRTRQINWARPRLEILVTSSGVYAASVGLGSQMSQSSVKPVTRRTHWSRRLLARRRRHIGDSAARGTSPVFGGPYVVTTVIQEHGCPARNLQRLGATGSVSCC